MTDGLRMSSKVVKQRAKGRRADRLALIEEQVESGQLVIRQATPEERERYGIRTGDEVDRGGEAT